MAFYHDESSDHSYVMNDVPPRSLPIRSQRTKREFVQITGTTGHTEVTATSFTTVPGLSFTMETTGGPVMIGWSGMIIRNTATIIEVLVYVDDVRATSIGYEYNGVWQPVGGSYPIGFGQKPFLTLPAGSHIYEVRARVDTGIGLLATDTDWRMAFWAEEMA